MTTFEYFFEYCFTHGNTLKAHRDFGKIAQEVRSEIKSSTERSLLLERMVWDCVPYTYEKNKKLYFQIKEYLETGVYTEIELEDEE